MALSTDAYLDTFYEQQDEMFFEARKEQDLGYLRGMIKYANIIKGENCLNIDFYYNFDRNKTEQELAEEAEMLVDILLSAKSYKKLTVGADGLRSCYLPHVFLETLIRELTVRQTRFSQLCLDLQFYAD